MTENEQSPVSPLVAHQCILQKNLHLSCQITIDPSMFVWIKPTNVISPVFLFSLSLHPLFSSFQVQPQFFPFPSRAVSAQQEAVSWS